MSRDMNTPPENSHNLGDSNPPTQKLGKSATLDEILELLAQQRMIVPPPKVFSTAEVKAAIVAHIAAAEKEARIEILELVLHKPESVNAARWTHENVKDSLTRLQQEGQK